MGRFCDDTPFAEALAENLCRPGQPPHNQAVPAGGNKRVENGEFAPRYFGR